MKTYRDSKGRFAPPPCRDWPADTFRFVMGAGNPLGIRPEGRQRASCPVGRDDGDALAAPRPSGYPTPANIAARVAALRAFSSMGIPPELADPDAGGPEVEPEPRE